MQVKLVFADWLQVGALGSIYNTGIGMELSSGSLHSGTVFEADLLLKDEEVVAELKKAWDFHKAYPAFFMMME